MGRKRALQEPTIKPSLAITMGDPAGIGPEVIVKALSDPHLHRACRLFVVGDGRLMAAAAESTTGSSASRSAGP